MLEQTRTNFRTALCLPPREGPRTSYMVVDATGTVAAPVRWRKSTMHAPRNRAPRPVLMAALLAATLAACGGDDGPGPTDQSGRLEGQVIIAGTEAGAGPLVGATVTISQIDENSPTGAVRTVAGTVTTDAGGRYGLDVGLLNGLFLVEAAGGSYVEPASGETIALDAAASIRTLHHLPLLAVRTDALVSPVGHLTHALAQALLDAGATGIPAADARLDDAHAVAADHLDRHFGDVQWESVVPANPGVPAPSPTEPVRAAFVLAGWPILAADLASAASASVQEVNTFSLMNAWADDLAAGPFPGAFDGNDGNEQGGGLLLGACPPYADVTCDENLAMCPIGACRNACDLYAGTPRAYFGGAVSKFIRSTSNNTGLGDADTLPVARAIADNPDELLFGAACRDNLDRTPPTITFEAPTPAAGAVVRQMQTVTARALDDTDGTPPRISLAGPTGPLPDADGIPDNEIASTTLDTAAITTATGDGSYTVTASAADISGNAATLDRTFIIDNTAPTLTVSQTGFFVRSTGGGGQDWWTANAAPTVSGTVDDANIARVDALLGATVVGTIPLTPGTTDWTLTINPGTVTLPGVDIAFVAVDAAGNSGQLIRRLRLDATPPALTINPSPVRSEQTDTISYAPATVVPAQEYLSTHTHPTSGPDLAASMSPTCASVTKHISLLGNVSGAYISELGGAVAGRNPIRFNLTANDDGVGLDLTRSRFRVVHRTTGAVALDWTPMPNATTVGTATSYAVDMLGFAIGASLPVIPTLMTTEGIYDVRLEAYDQLGRLTGADRCWDHHIIAPALRTVSTVTAATGGMSSLGLTTASLAASGSNGNLAAKFMQPTSIGASLIELRVDNPSQHTAYVTVSLGTLPTVAVSNQFALGNLITTDAAWTIPIANRKCSLGGTVCNVLSTVTYLSPVESDNIPGSLMHVRLYDVSTGMVEVAPCTIAEGCATSGTTYEFRLVGRAASLLENSPPRKFLVAVMTGPVLNFQPTNAAQPSVGPFTDTSGISGVLGGVTGIDRCTSILLDANAESYCARRGNYSSYRAAEALSYNPLENVAMSAASAPTAPQVPAAPFANPSLPGETPAWTTNENRN
jgi:hypothetical protein